MYGYIYDSYLLLYLEVVKFVENMKNKPCESGFEVFEFETYFDVYSLSVHPISFLKELTQFTCLTKPRKN